MTEETQVSAPEVAAVETPALPTNPSFEELAEATRRMRSQPPAEKVETPAPAEEEPQEPDPAEDPEEDSDEGEEIDAAPEPEQPRKGKPAIAQRIDKLNDKVRAERDRAAALEAQLEAERERNAQMAAFLKKLAGGEPEPAEQEEEVLDEGLAKRLGTLEEKIAVRDFNSALNQADVIGAQSYPGYIDAVNYLQAVEAASIIAVEQSKGRDLAPEKAFERARQKLGADLKEIYKDTSSPQALASYVAKRATMLGFTPKAAEKPAQKRTKIDMDAVERARKEAGAPTYQREMATPGGDWANKLVNRADKEYGDDSARKRLAAFGIGAAS